jgi:RimJ/RimL family protein N-acetyltransferase
MDDVEIEADGLLLRPWRSGDAEDVYRACQDPDIHRWTSVPSPYLREHAEGFVNGHTRTQWADGTGAPFGVFDRATGELLGANGLINLRRHSGEVGYWVAPWARGRGVATRATHAVAAWAQHTLGLARIAWRAEVGNHASRLVAQRLGFQLEGVQRSAGHRSDRGPVDLWSGALLPGQLRAPDAPVEPGLRQRALVFGGPQPRLAATTPAGEAISLRAPALPDLDAVVAQCRDPEAVRWTVIPTSVGPDDAVAWISGWAAGVWARGEGAVFAIAGPDDGYAGSVELRLISADVGDVGYVVAPWARGRGYASTALARVCGWAFAALGLHRVEWRAYLGNDASRRVARRAGFTMEGMARAGSLQRGELRDTWLGARLAGDPHP